MQPILNTVRLRLTPAHRLRHYRLASSSSSHAGSHGLQPSAALRDHELTTLLMVFTKRLREGIRRGRIRCSIRIWMRPHVKVGGRYRMDEGQIVVNSIMPIRLADITYDLARESGFSSVTDLLQTAKHGSGDNVYLIRFRYLPPGAWDVPRAAGENRHEGRTESGSQSSSRRRSQLLRRIRGSTPAGVPRKAKG